MIDDRFENALAEELAAYQERLERGECEPGSSAQAAGGEPLPAELLPDLENQKRCLDLLHALRQPRRPETELAGQNGHLNNRHDGRFQILDELGSGGFGIVWRARDPATGRVVALKVPRPEVLTSPELRKRFEQEAEAAARLDHPNIVPILEAGIDGIVPYIASTYYEGPTLARWLSENEGRVAPRQAAQIALALSKALTHAHERGVLHRDVKPSNVLLAPVADGDSRELPFEPKLMDFGLAKLGEQDQELTRTGAMLGTLKYMSPEQAAGRVKEITAATDVYGLGVVLYELLAGAPPFSSESDWLTLRQVLEDEPRSLSAVRRDVPRDLAVIVQKCLNKIPGQRYRGARELAEDLERYLAGKSIVARPVPPAERFVKWCRRNPAWAALVGVVALSMFSGVAFLSYSNVRIAAALESEQRTREQLTMRLYASDMRRADEAMDQANVALARDLLAPYAESTNGPDIREFAWHFLWGRLPHQESFLPKHLAPVYSLSFSPDGELIATGCADGIVRVWRRGSVEPMHLLACSKAEVNEVAFSPDGLWLAAACEDGLTRIWDTTDWSLRRELPIGGVITTEFFGRFDSWHAVALQANGMIVTAGQGNRHGGNFDAYVARYKPDGQIDKSFNEVGDAVVWKHGEPDNLMAVLVEPDGRIVGGGAARNEDFAIVRLRPDGTHDQQFGNGGEVEIDLGSTAEQALAAIRQPDGKYLLAGDTKTASGVDAALVRLQPDGSLDESFGSGGKLIAYSGTWDDTIHALALQPDGKLIAVGCTSAAANTSASGDTLLIRCNSNGTLDTSFDQDGTLIWRVSESFDRAKSVAVQQDGKIVVVGESIRDDRKYAFAARVNSDGAIDESFGQRGVVSLDCELSGCEFRAMVLQPDGKIVAVGAAGDAPHRCALVARLNVDGSRDEGFGTAGQVCWQIGVGSELNAVALQEDRRFVVAGQVLCGGTDADFSNLAIARFHPDGTLDRSLSPNGVEGIKFLPDSRRLITYAQQCIQLWDVERGERLAETFVPEFGIDAADVSADGRRLLTAGDTLLATWDLDALPIPSATYRLDRAVSAVATLPTDNSLVVGRANGELLVFDGSWQAQTIEKTEETALNLRAGRGGNAKTIRVSPDFDLLAAVYGSSVLVYRTTDWSRVAEIVTPSRVFDVQFRRDVRAAVTTASDGTIVEWPLPAQGDMAMGNAGRKLFQAESTIDAMALSKDESTIACGDRHGRISLIDRTTGQVRFETVPLSNPVSGLGFSPNDRELIVGYASGAVVSVNLVDHTVKTVRTLGNPIQKLIVSADGRKIAVALDETSKLQILSWPAARDIVEISHRGTPSHMTFNWSGQQIVVSGGPFLDVFETGTGKRLGGDADLGAEYTHFQVFRDDSRMVVAEGREGITIRELPSCRVLKRMLGGKAGIQRVAVSADGRNLASDGNEKVLRIWDTQTSETLLQLRDEEAGGNFLGELQFSREGDALFGFEREVITVWEARQEP